MMNLRIEKLRAYFNPRTHVECDSKNVVFDILMISNTTLMQKLMPKKLGSTIDFYG